MLSSLLGLSCYLSLSARLQWQERGIALSHHHIPPNSGRQIIGHPPIHGANRVTANYQKESTRGEDSFIVRVDAGRVTETTWSDRRSASCRLVYVAFHGLLLRDCDVCVQSDIEFPSSTSPTKTRSYPCPRYLGARTRIQRNETTTVQITMLASMSSLSSSLSCYDKEPDEHG